MLAQCRFRWRLLLGFFVIICIVEAAKSDKKAVKGNQRKLTSPKPDELHSSGQPPKSNLNVDDEVIRASGNNPDDEDSVPVVEGSGHPPQNIVKPSTTTPKPSTTTTREPNEFKLEDQDEDEDEDEEDEEEEEELPEADLNPVLRPNVPETTTTRTTSTTTTTTVASKPTFEFTTRRPVVVSTHAPTFPSHVESVNLDSLRPGLLAAISGGAVVGLLLTILLVMFVVYRMRKKDEGSYALDEGQHQPPHYSYAYQKAPTKEFYA